MAFISPRAVMSTLFGDRFALAAMGVLGIGVVWTVSTMIVMVMEDNKIESPKPKTQYITQDTEDALPVDTLDKLLYHPSYSIREVSLKILCDRAVNDKDTLTTLLHGITQKEYERRSECLRAIVLLVLQSSDALAMLHDERAYAALVRSLEIGLGDVERPKLDDANWDEYHLRDVAEKMCLVIVYNLVQKHGPKMLLQAKFVEKWLAEQAWGDTEEDRQRNFAAYRKSRVNNLIRDIIDIISNSRLGLSCLKEAKLMNMANRTSSGRRRSGLSISSSSDMPDDTVDVRRRRREAIVIHDGEGPLNHGDIILRNHRRANDDFEIG